VAPSLPRSRRLAARPISHAGPAANAVGCGPEDGDPPSVHVHRLQYPLAWLCFGVAYAPRWSSTFPSPLSSVSQFWPAEARWPSCPCPRRAAMIQLRPKMHQRRGWRCDPHRHWLPRRGRRRGFPSAQLVPSPVQTPFGAGVATGVARAWSVLPCRRPSVLGS